MSILSNLKSPAAWWSGGMAATTRWMESTLEVARWENMRKAGRRWGWWGGALGALMGLVLYSPASWLAQGLVVLSDGRLLLAESQGTVWNGDAVVVLTGGPGSRDARALPGRLNWTLRPRLTGLNLTVQQDCCVPTPVVIEVRPGWGRARIAVSPSGPVGHWPAAWLTGLGTPWNTLQLGGVVRLSTNAMAVEWVHGRVRLEGQAQVGFDDVSSSVTTLDRLGSYRIDLVGDPEGRVNLSLMTVDGALQLSGQGQVGLNGLRFRGEARANESERGALDSFLNIIGRRMGDRSVISIG
ncbi:type II secretion system protein N [Aquabacterium sp.]|uniref:type II secretion system protein N n=1 Tax=Aquabacterium sp. TaxID=1872578 RepID=UPI003D6CFCE6